MIADAERAQAIAGVMGGATRRSAPARELMALESVFPAGVGRRTSKRLGLKTEASTRFERGADVTRRQSARRAAALLEQIGAGGPLGPIIDRYPSPRSRPVRCARAARIARCSGRTFPPADVQGSSSRSGSCLASERLGRRGWDVTVPTFRVDVTRERI